MGGKGTSSSEESENKSLRRLFTRAPTLISDVDEVAWANSVLGRYGRPAETSPAVSEGAATVTENSPVEEALPASGEKAATANFELPASEDTSDRPRDQLTEGAAARHDETLPKSKGAETDSNEPDLHATGGEDVEAKLADPVNLFAATSEEEFTSRHEDAPEAQEQEIRSSGPASVDSDGSKAIEKAVEDHGFAAVAPAGPPTEVPPPAPDESVATTSKQPTPTSENDAALDIMQYEDDFHGEHDFEANHTTELPKASTSLAAMSNGITLSLDHRSLDTINCAQTNAHSIDTSDVEAGPEEVVQTGDLMGEWSDVAQEVSISVARNAGAGVQRSRSAGWAGARPRNALPQGRDEAHSYVQRPSEIRERQRVLQDELLRNRAQGHTALLSMRLLVEDREKHRERTGYTPQGLPDPDDQTLASLLKRRANDRKMERRRKRRLANCLATKVGKDFVNATREQEEFFAGKIKIADMDQHDLRKIASRMNESRIGNKKVDIEVDRKSKKVVREVRDLAQRERMRIKMEVSYGLRDPREDAGTLPVPGEKSRAKVSEKNRAWLGKAKKSVRTLQRVMYESLVQSGVPMPDADEDADQAGKRRYKQPKGVATAEQKQILRTFAQGAAMRARSASSR
eukprot:g13337.t1